MIHQKFYSDQSLSDQKITYYSMPARVETKSWQEHRHQIQKLASALRDFSKKSSVVALMLPTCDWLVSSLLGLQNLGRIPCCLYPPLRLGEIENWKKLVREQLEKVEADILITNRQIEPFVRRALGPFSKISVLTVEKIAQYSPLQFIPEKRSQDDIALLQFTSGSTGKTKAVMISYEALNANVEMILEQIPNKGIGESCFSWLPLYHDMGLVGALFSTLSCGSPLHLMAPEQFLARPGDWWRELEKSKATVTLAPNFAFGHSYNRMKKREDLMLDLSHLKTLLCGAEPISRSTIDQFLKLFKKHKLDQGVLRPVYGLAEATLAVSFTEKKNEQKWLTMDLEELYQHGQYLPPRENTIELPSLGRPLKGMEIDIRDNEGRSLKEGQRGEVWIRGKSLMSGYYNDPELTQDSIKLGWLRTGDTGIIWQDELYLTGRSKDLIIVRGKNIDPFFIEESLYDREEIRKGKVIAFSHLDARGELVVVLAESSFELTLDLEEDLRSHIKARVGVEPNEIQLLPPGSLPRTSSGKLKRKEAKERWFSETLQRKKAGMVKVVGEKLVGELQCLLTP